MTELLDDNDAASNQSFTSQKLDLINAMMIDPRLSPADARIAVVLLQHLNARTGQCNPSREAIAELASMTVRNVEKCLAHLKAKGWLQWQRGNRQRPNRYVFNVGQVEAMLDRRTELGDARRERRQPLFDANHSSPKKQSDANHSSPPDANHSSPEHLKGTPEDSAWERNTRDSEDLDSTPAREAAVVDRTVRDMIEGAAQRAGKAAVRGRDNPVAAMPDRQEQQHAHRPMMVGRVDPKASLDTLERRQRDRR